MSEMSVENPNFNSESVLIGQLPVYGNLSRGTGTGHRL